MLIKKKKIPTLNDIEKLFTYIPKIFILILGGALFVISYIILDFKQKKDIDLIEQELILHYEFKQKDNLNKFVDEVEKKVKNEFLDDEDKLKQIIYQTMGYMSAKYNTYLDINDLFFYLIKLQEKENIRFVVFEEDLNILYGHDTVFNMQKLMFNHKDNTKYQKLLLQYISSQGKNNLQSWKYDSQKNIILSFFDIIEIDNKKLYIGAISSVNNIKQTTKEIIINSIKEINKAKDYKIWFYDSNTNQTFNYNNDEKIVFDYKILNTSDKTAKKFEILKYYISNEHGNKEFDKYAYLNSKYSFLIGIDYDKSYILKLNQNKINEITLKYKIFMYKIFLYITLLITVLILFSFIFSKFIKKIFGKYNKRLKQKTQALEEHKNQMELLVIEEVEKNRKKDRILIQQSKLAAMGGMLENIAHQWRQPLNNVNLILHFIRDNYQNKEFTKEKLEKYINKSKIQIDYMSQTIDDFRNFYKPSKMANNFNISNVIKDVLKISKEQFEYDKIKVILSLCDIFIINYENELKQTLLNILNNAKDAIVLKRKRKDFEAFIKIKVIQNKKSAKIIIENNGGKIKKDVIEKVFEPYFTTRSESLGIGIGLYMAKTIIETNMKGKIKVENIKDGVRFKIILPLKTILK